MKKLIIAMALSLLTNVASAGGFSPWDEQTARTDVIDATLIDAAPTGFAPWRERTVPEELNRAIDYAVGVEATNIFRPWS